jgi:hypothetical protein
VSIVSIRAALETALNAMSPALSTAWENAAFTPVNATPYQRVNLLLAEPDNTEISARYTEQGFMQVSLCYPIGAGPGDAAARALALRQTFPRGATLTSGGIAVVIARTPEIAPAQIDGDRYVVPVRIRFTAQVSG